MKDQEWGAFAEMWNNEMSGLDLIDSGEWHLLEKFLAGF